MAGRSYSGFFGHPVKLKLRLGLIPYTLGLSTSTAAKQTKRGRKKRKVAQNVEEAHTIATEPPKLVYPFISGSIYDTNAQNSSTNFISNSKTSSLENITDATLKTNAQDSLPRIIDEDSSTASDTFITKEDTVEGRYYLFQSLDQEQYRLPSVTTVLQSTLPRSSWFGLRNWRKNMIEEHGEQGYRRIRSETIRSGTLFHQLLEERLMAHQPKGSKHSQVVLDCNQTVSTVVLSQETDVENKIISVNTNGGSCKSATAETGAVSVSTDKTQEGEGEEEEEGVAIGSNNHFYYESMKNVLKDVTDVVVTEGVVRHEQLGYSGTVDCVAHYKGELCVIEWKTSNKPRPELKDLHDYPLQIAAYAGALNSDPRYTFKVEKALIVVAYLTGTEAHAHWLDSTLCLDYWSKWLDRLNQFQTQFAHDLTDIYL